MNKETDRRMSTPLEDQIWREIIASFAPGYDPTTKRDHRLSGESPKIVMRIKVLCMMAIQARLEEDDVKDLPAKELAWRIPELLDEL